MFSGNALLSINGTSPYNAVYGRVPPLLPDTSMVIDDAGPGTQRHVQRLREISIQAMVEGTAKARVGRALNTRTQLAGQGHGYQIGDLVDFYRKASSKDAPGWKGPAKIVDNTNISRGTVTIRFKEICPLKYVFKTFDITCHSYVCMLQQELPWRPSGLNGECCEQRLMPCLQAGFCT